MDKTIYVVLTVVLSILIFMENSGIAADPCGTDHRCICDYVNGSDANGTQIITYTPDPECIDCGQTFKTEGWDNDAFKNNCTGSDGRARSSPDWTGPAE